MAGIDLQLGDVSEDGHPCEAALEFRRAVIRSGLADEVPADALDLAISYAWIGKALSRTVDAAGWLLAGIDPNTWQIIRVMSLDTETRRRARHSAVASEPERIFTRELKALRDTRAFINACGQVDRTTAASTHPGDISRLAVLATLARKLPGPDIPLWHPKAANVVVLAQFRKASGRR